MERLAARGVLVKDTHGSAVRLAPPLTIEPAGPDWMCERFADALRSTS